MSNKFLFALLGAITQAFAQTPPQVVPVPIQSQAPSVELKPALKPWPADKKLTIGELSALQEAKEREALLNKFGYTAQAQQVRSASPISESPRTTRAGAPAAAPTRFSVTGIFGSTTDPRAEILVDGMVRAVRAGDSVAGITVVHIERGSVVVRKGSRPTRAVAVGTQIEL